MRPYTPRVMLDPGLARKGEHWVRRCPYGPCATLTGIQGGVEGLKAHIAVVHPGKTATPIA